jgi:hypothetical protein
MVIIDFPIHFKSNTDDTDLTDFHGFIYYPCNPYSITLLLLTDDVWNGNMRLGRVPPHGILLGIMNLIWANMHGGMATLEIKHIL